VKLDLVFQEIVTVNALVGYFVDDLVPFALVEDCLESSIVEGMMILVATNLKMNCAVNGVLDVGPEAGPTQCKVNGRCDEVQCSFFACY
jgi:hypothetical protein